VKLAKSGIIVLLMVENGLKVLLGQLKKKPLNIVKLNRL